MRNMINSKTAAACFLLLVFSALYCGCSSETYDTGDGSLSYMRADFVEAQTDANAAVVSATLDDGTTLLLVPSAKADWIKAKDSLYRALLYYNKVEDKSSVVPVAVSQVLVPNVVSGNNSLAIYPADPVNLETAWMSRNKRYLNLGIYIKIGTKDGSYGTQALGFLHYGTVEQEDGSTLYKVRLVHSQNGVPEYYSTQVYMSIPIYRLPFQIKEGDKIEVDVNTYAAGYVSRTFDM